MVKLNKDFLHSVLKVQTCYYDQQAMQTFIFNEIISLLEQGIDVDFDTDFDGNIYVTRGKGEKGYPAVVAHMDTVHKVLPDNQFQIVRYGNTWHGFNPVKYEMTGIGGDDKVGVYIALEALRNFDNIKVAFFTDEEVGCVGSSGANMHFFKDCNLVLQADRRGNTDFIKSIGGVPLFDDEFETAVKPILWQYGYDVYEWGGITDVGELKEKGLGVACANISAGYHNPHSDNEFVHLGHVETVMKMMFHIIEELGDQRWDHKPDLSKKYRYGNYSYSGDTTGLYNKYANHTRIDYTKPALSGTSAAATTTSTKGSATAAAVEAEMSKVWDDKDYYLGGDYDGASFGVDYVDSVEDENWGKESDDKPEHDYCAMCGSFAVEYDTTEEGYWCWDCQDYTVLEWNEDEVTVVEPKKVKEFKGTSSKNRKKRGNVVSIRT